MKLKMCPECYNVYIEDFVELQYCPSYNCTRSSELFDVDDSIAGPISELNKLGFKTKFCCGGHDMGMGNISHPYIWFNDNLSFEYINYFDRNGLTVDTKMGGTHISLVEDEDIYLSSYKFRKILIEFINYIKTIQKL